MNTLIITAHPSEKGFTHKIARRYMDTKIKNGNTAQILDLYKVESMPFFNFESMKDENSKHYQLRKEMQKLVTEADELVFVHPMWWGTMPAIMKNWIDNVFTSGFSHKNIDGKIAKLLEGKSARVFVTSSASALIYNFIANPYKTIWGIITFGFVGIKTKSIDLLGNMDKRTEKDEENFLNKVEKLASK
jgi:NAD(P)H dehydrogenase (quinone)